jgi:hypothetical protein
MEIPKFKYDWHVWKTTGSFPLIQYVIAEDQGQPRLIIHDDIIKATDLRKPAKPNKPIAFINIDFALKPFQYN